MIGFFYVLVTIGAILISILLSVRLGSVDLSSSFLQQFDWVLYKAEAAWHSYSM